MTFDPAENTPGSIHRQERVFPERLGVGGNHRFMRFSVSRFGFVLVVLAAACGDDAAGATDGTLSSGLDDSTSTQGEAATLPGATDSVGDTSTSGSGSATMTGGPPPTSSTTAQTSSESSDTNSGIPSPIVVELDGEEQPPFSRVTLPDPQEVGTVSAPLVYTVRAPEGGFTIDSISMTPSSPVTPRFDAVHFQVDTSATSFNVGAGESTTFEVRCAPTNGGTKGAYVEIVSNAETSPYRLSVNCSTPEDRWHALAEGPPARRDGALHNLSSAPKELILIGGRNALGEALNDVWIYDIDANEWTDVTPNDGPSARYGHAVSTFPGGMLAVHGGFIGTSEQPTNETWRYDIEAQTWTLVSSVGPELAWHRLVGQTILGGVTIDGALNDGIWSADLAGDGIWAEFAGAIGYGAHPTALGVSGALLAAYAIGGVQDGVATASATVIDLTGMDVEPVLDSSFVNPFEPRIHHDATLVGDRTFVVFGGQADPSSPGTNDVYVFRPQSAGHPVIEVGAPPVSPPGRHSHLSAGRSDGKLYIFGGATGGDDSEVLGDFWEYEPPGITL